MSAVKLMNRIDTKFVTSLDRLPELLQKAGSAYFVQEVDGTRQARYDTLYYDTPNLAMYVHHHDRILRRQKVRIRTYIDSDLTFLEIKNKNNKGRTKKKRIEVSDQQILLNPTEVVNEFMQKRCWYDWNTLMPQLRTSFTRITLVNKNKTERLTIDFNVIFENQQTNTTYTNPNLVIVELKRDGNNDSPMLKIMQELQIRPLKISKYCIGTALTNSAIKQNRFKGKIRKIAKITNTPTIY